MFWMGLVSLGVFYFFILGIGLWAARRSRTGSTQEVLLAGRALPLWLAIFTMSATWVGGGYINGTAEATARDGLLWVQAPWAYALSLFVGGIFFARQMRRQNYCTFLDPFEKRYGKKVTALLCIPAVLGELFWTAAILTALGTTFGTLLGIDIELAVILSAVFTLAYTSLGGLWAVAYTDVIQLGILVVGLWVLVPFGLEGAGGWSVVWESYHSNFGSFRFSTLGNSKWQWWDCAFLLVLGGIPWQVYFQRVLAAKNENTAMGLSLFAAIVCLIAAVPALVLGMVGQVTDWSVLGITQPDASLILPYVLRYLLPPALAVLGVGALAAAVMSSADSSILSSSSLLVWNVYRPWNPKMSSRQLSHCLKICVWILGAFATLLALKLKSVYALWFLCSDLVYTLLFAQLFCVIYDKKSNAVGAVSGFFVAFILRLGAGYEDLGISSFLPYPRDDGTNSILLPYRTIAMVSGLITIMAVSRLTDRVRGIKRFQILGEYARVGAS